MNAYTLVNTLTFWWKRIKIMQIYYHRACTLTGVGKRTMMEISQALKEGRCPQAKVSKRGEWERAMPRHILTYVSFKVLTIFIINMDNRTKSLAINPGSTRYPFDTLLKKNFCGQSQLRISLYIPHKREFLKGLKYVCLL